MLSSGWVAKTSVNLIGSHWFLRSSGPSGLRSQLPGVGEVDGNEFGGGKVVIFAYGPDADALSG